jgi:large repetitive protein
MLKQFTCALAAAGTATALVLALAAEAKANVSYQIDGGKSQTAFGISDSSCVTAAGFTWGDLLWLNSFQVQPGGEVIDSISVAWGTPKPISPRSSNCPSNVLTVDSGLGDAEGSLARVLLYSDPNNDGNPNDAQLLRTVETRIVLPGQDPITGFDIFQTIAIPEIELSGNFFVGALFPNQQEGQFPAALDFSNPVRGRSWAAYRLVPPFGSSNAPPVTDLTQTPVISLDNLPSGTDSSGNQVKGGNWLLRANGKPVVRRAVPESNLSIGLLFIGAIGAGKLLQRKLTQ